MRTFLPGRGSLVVVGLAVLCATSRAASQTTSTLSELTVPSANLPSGCQLKPLVPRASAASFDGNVVQLNPALANQFPSNPWIGTDAAMKSKVRMSIDVPPPMPDAPPDRRAMASLEMRFGDEVAEAYRAEYIAAGGEQVSVSAARFNDPRLAMPAAPAGLGRRSDQALRLVRASTVIVVNGNPNTECFAAIAAHVKAPSRAAQQAPSTASAQAGREIDAEIWNVLIDTVAKDDVVRMGSTYAPDAVLVEPRITKSIKSALEGWGRDMVTAKANGSHATVEFRFTRRQDDAATAFEAGLFKYTVIDKAGVSKPVYVPFEELLAKIRGKWLILMERQFTPVTQADWDKLAK